MENRTEKLFTVDGLQFNVLLIKLSRSADILDKFAHRSMDGVLHREIIGTYINYSLEFAYNDDPLRYNQLWSKLIEPEPLHYITLPDNIGYNSFRGYISNVKDNIIYANTETGERKFKNLSCDIVSVYPNNYVK